MDKNSATSIPLEVSVKETPFLYLFILCMEMFSDYINYHVDIGLWNLIKISTRGPPFSHLVYAVDFTFMAKATNSSIQATSQK